MSTCCERQATPEIVGLEKEIREKKQLLAELRRAQPAREIQDYELRRSGETIRLSQMFDGKSDLILIHNMGTTCPYCTMWADGFNGLYDHLRDRAAFVLV